MSVRASASSIQVAEAYRRSQILRAANESVAFSSARARPEHALA